MKTNKKILATLSLFLTFALSACANPFLPNRSSKPSSFSSDSSEEMPFTSSSSSGKTSIPSYHTHKYGEWIMEVAPTCVDNGVEVRYCYECGEKQARAVQAYGHDYDYENPLADTSTCVEPGYKICQCRRCGDIVQIPSQGEHKFNDYTIYGPNSEGEVSYQLARCRYGDAIKIDIAAMDCTLESGTSLKYLSTNFMRMTNNGGMISWRFTSYDEGKTYYGMLYQRGLCDVWDSGNGRSRSYGMYSGSGEQDPFNGNFEVKVNGTVVDKTAYLNTPYEELLAGGEDSSYIGSNYSPIALAPIGYVSIVPGTNEISYRRISSYNLYISDLVFIGTEIEHNHTLSNSWEHDDFQHWQTCTDPNCPMRDAKFNLEEHSFNDVVVKQAATHDEPGYGEKECAICHYIEQVNIPALGHEWGSETIIGSDESKGTVSYTKKQCVKDGAYRLSMRALDGALAEGSAIKSGTPDGYIKLNSKGNSITLSFEYDSVAYGQIYQRGVTDSFSSNKNQSYSTSGSGTYGCNFSMTVNGVEVDTTETKYITYGSMLSDGEVDPNLSSSYSPVADCLIGDVALSQGINTITYTRTGSYNLCISEFVFVVTNSDHQHVVSTNYESNENMHWHVCTDPACPIRNSKIDVANHTWNEWETTKEPTCSEYGERRHECSICHYVATETLAMVDHSWSEWEMVKVPTYEESGLKQRTCSACGEIQSIVVPQNAYYHWTEEELLANFVGSTVPTEKEYADGSKCFKSNLLTNGSITLQFQSTLPQSFKLKMLISIKIPNINSTGFWKQGSSEKMVFIFNGVQIEAPETDINFKELGCDIEDGVARDSSALSIPVWIDICDIDTVVGVNELSFRMNNTGYSFFIGGLGLFLK